MSAKQTEPDESRRAFVGRGLAGLSGLLVCGLSGAAAWRGGLQKRHAVWQIDPAACTHCGKCATECVLPVSAVKCMHNFAMCGYCNLCFGYFTADAPELTSGGENQICPTGAIRRRFIEEPYYEYTIDEDLCIGCARCVKTCTDFGNGSLYMQVRHDLCVDCEECAIARACPSTAFRRVSPARPYLRKGEAEEDA